MTRPDGSFGWKKVLLAGIDSPASATSTICRDGSRPHQHGQAAGALRERLLRLGLRVHVAHRRVGHAEQRPEHGVVEEVGVERAQAGRTSRREQALAPGSASTTSAPFPGSARAKA